MINKRFIVYVTSEHHATCIQIQMHLQNYKSETVRLSTAFYTTKHGKNRFLINKRQRENTYPVFLNKLLGRERAAANRATEPIITQSTND